MEGSLDELRQAVANKLTQLLKDDEAGWDGAASWISTRASEQGFDLWLDFKDPQCFSESLVQALKYHTDFERFPNGLADLERFEVAEELFWHLMPHCETDYSAFEPAPPKRSVRISRYVKNLLQRLITKK